MTPARSALAVGVTRDTQERVAELLNTDDAVERTLLDVTGRILYRELKKN